MVKKLKEHGKDRDPQGGEAGAEGDTGKISKEKNVPYKTNMEIHLI